MFNWILIGLVVLLILLVLFAKFYQKSSKDVAFVRTGMFGQKIVLTGGALAIPIFHQTTPVNMNTLKLEIERKENNGFITKDKMRVDIKKSFEGGKGHGKFKALLKKELESQKALFINIQEMKEGYEKRVDTESLSEQLIQRRTHDLGEFSKRYIDLKEFIKNPVKHQSLYDRG